MAVVQDHKLDVTEDVLHWVIIGTTFGQADPMELQIPHRLAGLARFARMRTILIQRHPNRGIRIPLSQAAHELLDIGRTLTW